MTDWPATPLVVPTHIHSFSRFAAGGMNRLVTALGAPAAQNWTANLAVYVPFHLPVPFPVQRVFWLNGSTTTGSSVDFGVYTDDGIKVFSTGVTAMLAGPSFQYASVAARLLDPGSYYFAWACDGTTNRANVTLVPAADGELMGLLVQQLGSLALPATMTEAAYAGQGLPGCGITRMASGF